MKQIATILFLLFSLYSFGQNQTDTERYNPSKSKEYTPVTPKQSEYKLITPQKKQTKHSEDFLYNENWADNSDNAFTHEINVTKHKLKTERLTYEQMQYLQSLPYIK